jgi:uncharacterized protein YlxW (UPF0749 family)
MKGFTRVVVFAVCISSALLAQDQPQTTKAPAKELQPQREAGMSREQVRELQADLERMRNMVEQMQTNIAFISSPQTPMKHQFELEIEMWQLVIDRMDRKIKEATGRQ